MSTNRRSSSRLRVNSPPAAAANTNPNPLPALPEDATTREADDNPREGTLQDLQRTESYTIATENPIAGQTADPAVGGLEAELREVEALAYKKNRLLASLRETEREIAILKAKAQGAAYHPPDTARPMPAASVVSQGSALGPPIFRREVQEPRTPSNMNMYKAESLDEYDLFKARQKAFWMRYPDWFCNDTRKVDRVTEFLAPKVEMAWMAYCKHNPNKEFTWLDFETWALAQVIDPVEMQREALHKWWTTMQAKNQDVREYALKLTFIHNRLADRPRPKDRINRLADRPRPKDRINRLHTGVVKEVQVEARRWFNSPQTEIWDDWVAFFNRIEKSMPARMTYLKEGHKTTPRGNTDTQGPRKKPFRGRGTPARQQSTQAGSAEEGKQAFTGSKRDRNGESRTCVTSRAILRGSAARGPQLAPRPRRSQKNR
jgi:hypothetical protein